jgi:hypothetical protein
LPLESVFGSIETTRLGVSSSAIGSVLESMLVSVLENVLQAYLGAYSQSGWEGAIECNWARPREHARQCTCERLRSLIGSVSQEGRECAIDCSQECTSKCLCEWC